ncbi:enoyl-CoA hydratase [Oceanicella actignis]|uniref:enoyl-CoA hydratase n=1 Tax=Oceanicella actignis TaxID=1189325 RepID=UPI0011E69796|nr:enoyl-CoA hydratase [Oceanicella actignis]TYO89609.1 enoyl-CoA hydratase [Oceanicella actignis]
MSAPREAEPLIVRRKDGVATVILNRPQAMNALSRALRVALAHAMAELSADDEVRAVILTGAGERAFCAGLDLKELGADPEAIAAANPDSAAEDPALAVGRCPKPVIGAINGVAITGGFELALACDILIASRNARFADTHARVGIMPGWGLSQKLPRIIGPSRAKEMSFTGAFIGADRALQWGLVNHVFAPEALLPEAERMAAEIAQADPEFIMAYKALIDDGYARTLAEGLALEAERSRPWNAAQTPEKLEARRAAVIARGRAQL